MSCFLISQFAEYSKIELASLSAKSTEVGSFAQPVEYLALVTSNYMQAHLKNRMARNLKYLTNSDKTGSLYKDQF